MITTDDGSLSPDELAAIGSTDGVQAADAHAYIGVEVTGSAATEWVSVGPTPSDPSLAVGTLAEGRDATADGEIVLAEGVSERVGAGIGDTVQVSAGAPEAGATR